MYMNYLSHHLHNESLINELSVFVLVSNARKKGETNARHKKTNGTTAETKSRAEELLPTEAARYDVWMIGANSSDASANSKNRKH